MPEHAKHRYKSLRLARHSNIPWLGRTRLMAHLQGALAARGPNGGYPLLALFVQRPWPWLAKYLKGIFNGRFKPFPSYSLDGHDGIYPLHSATAGRAIRLSIAGDWGTGTEEAVRVAENMSAFRPDYTIHLGDVYYIGDAPEVDENFLGIPCTGQTPVQFPRGAVGTLTMPGNHELYGGGRPYYTKVLPFGSPAPGQTQRASFFSLESGSWRILGLDTGYNSAGIPILGSIPGLSSIPWIGGDGRLEASQIDWLRSNIRPRERPKATLILSHHQYFSAFPDEVFPRPAQQLREFFSGQDVLWIWGHEHRLAIYDLYTPDGSLRCYGRCIGHGGMPVETTPPRHKNVPLRFRDPRTDYPIGEGSTAGWNGFLNLTLDGERLTLDYRDITNRRLYTESFTATPTGAVQLLEPSQTTSS
jgi:hypothetical protein